MGNVIVQAGRTINLDDYIAKNGTEGAISYDVDTSTGCAIADNNKLTVDIDAEPGNRTVTVEVAEDNNYQRAETTMTVTVAKSSQAVLAIDAKDVTTTYSPGGHVTIDATVKNADGTPVTEGYGSIVYPTDPPQDNPYLQSSENLSNTLTILKAGTIYVAVSAGGNDVYAFVCKNVKVTINKESITPTMTLSGWNYGDTAKTPTVTENTGKGAVTYSYSGTTRGGATFGPSASAPTQAGTYTVTATVAESDNYFGGICTADFTIAPKSVDATVAAEDKTYDGTADANVSATVSTGLLEGDSLTVSGLKGTFSDAKAGKGKTVAIDSTGATFTGVGAANYEVAIPSTTTAAIAKADLSKAKVTTVPASYAYDGKAKKPAVKVTLNGKVLDLKAGTDYKLTYKNNKKIGTATVTVAGKGSCTGTKSAKFKIKMANALTVKVAKASVKASSKASAVRPITQVATMYKTTVTYAKATTAKAKKLNGYEALSVNEKTGKVTVKAGARPGTYKMMMKVSAAETAEVKDVSKTVTVTVKVTGKAPLAAPEGAIRDLIGARRPRRRCRRALDTFLPPARAGVTLPVRHDLSLSWWGLRNREPRRESDRLCLTGSVTRWR